MRRAVGDTLDNTPQASTSSCSNITGDSSTDDSDKKKKMTDHTFRKRMLEEVSKFGATEEKKAYHLQKAKKVEAELMLAFMATEEFEKGDAEKKAEYRKKYHSLVGW
jgi:hypothetical protein